MSVTLTLDDEVDVSRGDVISTTPLHATRRLSAHVVWMDERPLDPDRVYLLKHAAKTVTAVSYVWFTPTTTKPWLASSSAIALSSSGGKPLGDNSSTG